MICYNKDILFLHIPKCGGLAITEYLQRTIPNITNNRLQYRHLSLNQFVMTAQVSPLLFQKIIAVVRNPYDREVSQYTFWREEYDRGKRGPEFELAHNKSFAEFIADPVSNFGCQGNYGKGVYWYWMNFNKEILPNLDVVKLDDLTQLEAVVQPFQLLRGSIDKTNTSNHKPWEEYYDDDSKKIVQEKFKWTFEMGLYDK